MVLFSAAVLTYAIVISAGVLRDTSWLWLSEGESGSATLRNLGLFVVALVGLPFAMWRTVVASRQADIAQRALLNDRHQKAVEMLGHHDLVVRLGGIYALQHLAKEHSDHYHVQVMGLFCAFLGHTNAPEPSSPMEDDSDAGVGTRSGRAATSRDAQDVLRAIGARDRKSIELEEKGGFEVIVGAANLSGVQMYDVINFTYDPRSWMVIERKPRFRANLSHMHFRYTNLSNANLSFVDMSSSEFCDPNLADARLEGANLSKTAWDGGTLKNAQLSSVDLSKASIRETSLAGADLSSANLSGVVFQGVDLSKAELRNTELSGTSFSLIERGGAGFTRDGAKQFGIEPNEYIVGVSGLTQAQIDQAWADPGNPPQLEGVLDAGTGQPLVWRGRTKAGHAR